MAKRISRKSLEQFIARKKLGGVVGFLNFVRQPSRARHFVKFPATYAATLLFHGSRHYNAKLSIPSSGEKFVYATDDPNYAIFLAALDLKDASAGVVAERGKTKLTVDLAFVNGSSSLRGGWVHVISGEYFKKMRNREFVSVKSADVLFAIPVKPSDLTEPVMIVS